MNIIKEKLPKQIKYNLYVRLSLTYIEPRRISFLLLSVVLQGQMIGFTEKPGKNQNRRHNKTACKLSAAGGNFICNV